MSQLKEEKDCDSSDICGELSTEPNPKAEELYRRAQKKLKGFSFLQSNKYEDAMDLLEKAASSFQSSRNWDRAADCFMEIADIMEKHIKDSPMETASYYVKCAMNAKKFDTKKAIDVYTMAISLYTENGKHGSAARLYKVLGEMYEEDRNIEEARRAYIRAADCYIVENQNANANTCRIKAADLFAEGGQFKKAADVYEKCSKQALVSNLLKWSAKDWLYKGSLCHFVLCAREGNMEKMGSILQEYKNMLPALDGSREMKLLENCLNAVKEEDEEAFRSYFREHDAILKADAFTSKCLSSVIECLSSDPPLQEPDIC